jgi:hypothetical protein
MADAMTDTPDLIRRLRKHEHRMARDCFTMQASVLREARAEIERLRAKLDEWEQAHDDRNNIKVRRKNDRTKRGRKA